MNHRPMYIETHCAMVALRYLDYRVDDIVQLLNDLDPIKRETRYIEPQTGFRS
jgi:hypothetical protein